MAPSRGAGTPAANADVVGARRLADQIELFERGVRYLMELLKLELAGPGNWRA